MPPNRENQLDLSLETPWDGYFDQAVGLSQKIINKNLKNAFDEIKKMQVITHNDPIAGQVIGSFLAPRVILLAGDSQNVNKILYQIRFDKANYIIDENNGINLDNWIITVRCELANLVLNPVKDATTAQQKKQLEMIKTNFLIPGDYSVERLFAVLSSAQWSYPEVDRSYCGLDKDNNPIPWKTWWSDHGNMYLQTKLGLLLGNWCKVQENRGGTTLGVKFCLPGPMDFQKPTFAPTALHFQIHPYVTEGHPDGTPGIDDDGDFNCVAYCENIKDRELPAEKKLMRKPKANFSLPKSVTGAEDIDGTFVINHRLLLDDAILKLLQELVQGCEILVEEDVVHLNATANTVVTSFISIGPNQHGDDTIKKMKPPLPATDEHFKMKKHETEPHTFYFYNKSSTKNNKEIPFEQSHVGYKFITYVTTFEEGITDIKAKYKPGTPFIEISGTTSLRSECVFAFNRIMTEDRSDYSLHYECTWSFDVEMASSENGVLRPILRGVNIEGGKVPDYLLATIEADGMPPKHREYMQEKLGRKILPANLKFTEVNFVQNGITTGFHKVFEAAIKSNIEEALSKYAYNIRTKFVDNGKFVYPGNGVLNFSNNIFNNFGDLLTTVTYKPLAVGDKIQIPDAKDKRPEVPVTRPTPEVQPLPPVVRPLPSPTNLVWSTNVTWWKSNGRARIILTARNNTQAPLAFGWISLIMQPNKEGKPLFEAQKWDLAAELVPVPVEPEVKPGAGEQPIGDKPAGDTPTADEPTINKPTIETPVEEAKVEEAKLREGIEASGSAPNMEAPAQQAQAEAAGESHQTESKVLRGVDKFISSAKQLFHSEGKQEHEPATTPPAPPPPPPPPKAGTYKLSFRENADLQYLKPLVTYTDSGLLQFLISNQGPDFYKVDRGVEIRLELNGKVTGEGKFGIFVRESQKNPDGDEDDDEVASGLQPLDVEILA